MVEERSELGLLISELTKTRLAMVEAKDELVRMRTSTAGVVAALKEQNRQLREKLRRLQDYAIELEKFHVEKINVRDLIERL